jgi:hypothetical protein
MLPLPVVALNEAQLSVAPEGYVMDNVQEPVAVTEMNWLPEAAVTGFVFTVKTGIVSTLSSEPQAVKSKANSTLKEVIVSALRKDIR